MVQHGCSVPSHHIFILSLGRRMKKGHALSHERCSWVLHTILLLTSCWSSCCMTARKAKKCSLYIKWVALQPQLAILGLRTKERSNIGTNNCPCLSKVFRSLKPYWSLPNKVMLMFTYKFKRQARFLFLLEKGTVIINIIWTIRNK